MFRDSPLTYTYDYFQVSRPSQSVTRVTMWQSRAQDSAPWGQTPAKTAQAIICWFLNLPLLRQEKGDCMATTDIGFPANSNKHQGNILTWTATILACTYIMWGGTML